LISDYSQRGAPIRVAFFDDRIDIENPGILLPGMTIEDMKQGISKIRNPVIARVFRELELIEYTIPDKPNSRLQKYRLTARGNALLAQLGE
jgi:Putative ATP-dependent DNA helicase recG C-terminal